MGRTGSRRGVQRQRAELLVRQEVFLLVQKGRAALRRGRLAEAEASLRKVLGIDPYHRGALGALGEIHLRRSEFPAACECLERALEAGERTEHLLYTMANACRGALRRDRALKYYQQLVELNPNHVKGMTRLGESLLERKDFDGARQRFERVLELESHNPFALRGLAAALRGMRDYQAAIRVFEELTRLNPEDYRVLVRLGEAYAHEGDQLSARRAFRLVLQIDPDNHYASEGLARLAATADRGLRSSQS